MGKIDLVKINFIYSKLNFLFQNKYLGSEKDVLQHLSSPFPHAQLHSIVPNSSVLSWRGTGEDGCAHYSQYAVIFSLPFIKS